LGEDFATGIGKWGGRLLRAGGKGDEGHSERDLLGEAED